MSKAKAGALIDCGPDSPLVDELIASPNIGERKAGVRPDCLIMHYTGLPTFQRSIDVLKDPACEVSCHYVVDTDGHVVQMVREADRAWHAGRGRWHSVTDINSHSIGIEIQNPGHEQGYPDFPEPQMHAVEKLAGDIIARHMIRRERVLAHSDTAPQRKIDPGEKFDWRRLNRAGIGHWTAPYPLEIDPAAKIDPGKTNERVHTCQQMLAEYGYEVATDGLLSLETRRVIAAFQRHFRPACISGEPDGSTIATLRDLLDTLPASDLTT